MAHPHLHHDETLSPEDFQKRESLLSGAASHKKKQATTTRLDDALGSSTLTECLAELNKGLDITNDEMDFDEIDELLDKFQQDERVKDALSQGVNLREYAVSIEKDLNKTERESVGDYIAESHNFLTLLNTVNTCDEILQRMENMLSGFQSDLGNISSEIKYLQEQSSSMSVQLRNRKAVEQKLSSFINDIMLPKTLVNNICSAEVNELYLECLTQLNGKIQFTCSAPSDKVIAFKEMHPHLESLKNKAITKIREFLMQRIYALRKPNTNVQIMQQSTLVKYKYLFHFVSNYAPEVAIEICRNYVETMNKIFTAHFRSYIQTLTKLIQSTARKIDLLGVPEEQRKATGGWLSSGSKIDLKAQTNLFSLGERGDILQQLNSPSIKIAFEEMFRSYHHLLLDTITHEFAFQSDFFGNQVTSSYEPPATLPKSLVSPSPPPSPRKMPAGVLRREDMLDEIFSKSLTGFLECLSLHLTTSYDAVGLLLMLRMDYQFQTLMSKTRKILIPGLERYFGVVRDLLQQRFVVLLNMNTESLINASLPRLQVRDTHPHYITLRYAEFTAARCMIMNGVENEWWHGGGVSEAIAMLRRAMEALLIRMSAEQSAKKNQTIFLINNYDLILKIMKEREIFADETEKFTSLLDEQISAYVQQDITHHYGKMVDLVEDVKQRQLRAETTGSEIYIDREHVERIIEDFSATWKAALVQISGEVMNFSNFIKGAEILKRVLTELAVVYKDFSDIVKRHTHPLSKNLVPQPTLTYEIKKYSRSFD